MSPSRPTCDRRADPTTSTTPSTYAAVTAAVAHEITGPHAELLEHLADRIAAKVLDLTGGRATSVTVTVLKLRPPVPYDLASAAVTITRP